MIVPHALLTLQLLISAALLAKVLATLDKEMKLSWLRSLKSLCENFDYQNKDYQCSDLKGGLVSARLIMFKISKSFCHFYVCCFVAALVFVVDTVIYIVMYVGPSHHHVI